MKFCSALLNNVGEHFQFNNIVSNSFETHLFPKLDFPDMTATGRGMIEQRETKLPAEFWRMKNNGCSTKIKEAQELDTISQANNHPKVPKQLATSTSADKRGAA
jgi:hypothetical protein